ncbi:hypothetical protein DPMN_119095 [Dreissena polymorpha]|uniref:Uncharacterized protein n=1 Tax=Dreissena polymorpha TaxID=45954 RepID=A0A9D4GIN2_DREPO|nr:hypothetical protein DPMN_119095 [Dreissena polymorpha]
MKEPNTKDANGFFGFLHGLSDIPRDSDTKLRPIQAKAANQEKHLSVGIKLAITLRYLVLGDNNHYLMYGFVHCTNSKIIIRSAM